MKFFALLTKLIRARSLNIEQVEKVKKRKKERGQYQAILIEQACKFFLRDQREKSRVAKDGPPCQLG